MIAAKYCKCLPDFNLLLGRHDELLGWASLVSGMLKRKSVRGRW